MMNEPVFAEQIFADADNALAGYDLNADELAQIKTMSRAEFMSFTTEERKSFAATSTVGGSGHFKVRTEGG